MIEINQEYAELLSEVSIILNSVDKSLIDKLPKKLIKFIYENKSNSYKPSFESEKNFSKEQLKIETRQFLAYLYYMYWSDKSEKSEYEKLLRINESNYQNNLREQYNPDNIFKNEKNIREDNNTLSIIQYKESIIKRIINKIKNLIK